MPSPLVISGIDTDAGKSIVSAILCRGLEAAYWKPVQSGRLPHTDSQFISKLTESQTRIYPESYLLEAPMSPHSSAAKEGITIDMEQIKVPEHDGFLVIEGAGGLMVPLNWKELYIDLFAKWSFPVVLVVKTYLGSINHSLLSIEALRSRQIPVAGIIFNEGDQPSSAEAIHRFSAIPVLGSIPFLGEEAQLPSAEKINEWINIPLLRSILQPTSLAQSE